MTHDDWKLMTPEQDQVYREVKRRGDGFVMPAIQHKADCDCALCDRFKFE